MEELRQGVSTLARFAGFTASLRLFHDADIDHRRAVLFDQIGEIRQSADMDLEEAGTGTGAGMVAGAAASAGAARLSSGTVPASAFER